MKHLPVLCGSGVMLCLGATALAAARTAGPNVVFMPSATSATGLDALGIGLAPRTNKQ